MILSLLPEILLCTVIVLLLILTLVKNAVEGKWLARFLTAAGAALAVVSILSMGSPEQLFFGSYRVDLLSQGFKLILALSLMVTGLFSAEWEPVAANRRVEYYLFMVTGLLGMTLILSAADLLLLFVALELSAYSLYLVAALQHGERNAQASVKYFIFGAAASGASLWGLSLIVGLSGTTSLQTITANAILLSQEPAFLVGSFLFLTSLLFKLSAFPMHFWAPDVYECASTTAVNFIATCSKAAAVAVLIRILFWLDVPASASAVLGVLAFFSMTLGNTAALLQKDVKRLLAYSSIAQAGYLLLGLLAGKADGYGACFFYAFAYAVMNAGAFLVTLMVARNIRSDNPQISDFDGLAEKSPFLALLLLLSLLSLAGIPPLLGFTGKWFLFTAPMIQGHWFLVLWAVLNSVVSLFYYLTLVKHAYLYKPKNSDPISLTPSLYLTGLVLFLALVVLGIYPNGLVEFASAAMAQAGML